MIGEVGNRGGGDKMEGVAVAREGEEGINVGALGSIREEEGDIIDGVGEIFEVTVGIERIEGVGKRGVVDMGEGLTGDLLFSIEGPIGMDFMSDFKPVGIGKNRERGGGRVVGESDRITVKEN